MQDWVNYEEIRQRLEKVCICGNDGSIEVEFNDSLHFIDRVDFFQNYFLTVTFIGGFYLMA